MWRNSDPKKDYAHYSIIELQPGANGLTALKEMFPDEKSVNELNFVLFSTSGVHGTYNSIEGAESSLNGKDPSGFEEVTFLVVHPRLVALRYGNCRPMNQDDIEYLKNLRRWSHEVISEIGMRMIDKEKKQLKCGN